MSLQEILLEAFKKFKDNDAIFVDGKYYTFDEIFALSQGIIKEIEKQEIKSPFIAIFCERSVFAYAGIFACVLSGYAYLPLNPKFPKARVQKMLDISKCDLVIYSSECQSNFKEIKNESLKGIFADEIVAQNEEFLPQKLAKSSDFAYLLFTSGSTGTPKGVGITNANLLAYLENAQKYLQILQTDRVSQMFDITFDLSVHDIFLSFLNGATLFVVPKSQLLAPIKFIKKHNLSVFFATPSVISMMDKIRLLREDFLPNLRLSLFCGEPFLQKNANLWANVAKNSKIINLYGPTEATIACFYYEFKKDCICKNGIVPIGRVFDGQKMLIENDELQISGTQVANSYFKDELKTKDSFVKINDELYYKTGDLVSIENDIVYYLGRMDEQIKIRGFRVELLEIDYHIQKAANQSLALCVPLIKNDEIKELYAVVCGSKEKKEQILESLKLELPSYMMVKDVIFKDSLPLNQNSKINRKELILWLEKIM